MLVEVLVWMFEVAHGANACVGSAAFLSWSRIRANTKDKRAKSYLSR